MSHSNEEIYTAPSLRHGVGIRPNDTGGSLGLASQNVSECANSEDIMVVSCSVPSFCSVDLASVDPQSFLLQ